MRVNVLDWVPEDHVVRLVIDTVEAVVAPGLTARLVPAVRSRKGHRRYDPVMLLAYSYLSAEEGSTRLRIGFQPGRGTLARRRWV